MSYTEILENILLSNKVVESFYDRFNNDKNFKVWLEKTMPHVIKCEEREQNTKWHKYNVLKHILYSVEDINKRTKDFDFATRKMLAYVMFFHDAGKPYTHVLRIKDGVERDTFPAHNVVSCKIAKLILEKLGFNHNEIIIMDQLIYKHDIFMFIRLPETKDKNRRPLTYDLIRKEIEKLNKFGDGYKLLEYLVLIGKSDNSAQNEKMTAESLQIIETFEKMLQELKNK